AGSMISLSAMTIPILLETTTDAFQLLCQWTRVYYYGHHVLLGIAIWTFLSYTLVCFRRRKAVTSKLWHLLAVTVLSTVSIILFTLLIMKHTNGEIIPYGIHDENDSVGRAQGPRELVVSWGFMHAVRSTFPLVGAILGVFSTS
ncbi:hypothetical protein COCC4DRAFT_149821, partial [Bipolaris maydis ATCC 48331]